MALSLNTPRICRLSIAAWEFLAVRTSNANLRRRAFAFYSQHRTYDLDAKQCHRKLHLDEAECVAVAEEGGVPLQGVRLRLRLQLPRLKAKARK